MPSKIRRNEKTKKSSRIAEPPVRRREPERPSPETLEVVIWPSEILSQPARAVQIIDPWLVAVAEKMKKVMEESKGVGLAGPQVGLGLRIFVMSESGRSAEATVWINPMLSAPSGEEVGEEGCLSIPNIRGNVTRAKEITIRGMDITGQMVEKRLADFPARIAQHEFDHLEGVLILDRFSSVQKIALRKKIRALERGESDSAA